MVSRLGWLGAFALALFVLQGIVLYLMGQPLICECGYVKIWEGVVLSSGNSQHLTDWYTFSHVQHGFAFYLALWFLFPRLSIAQRFMLAAGLEVAWEVFENTPMIIEHYREQALAQGYVGDSVLNSLSDTFAMMAGYLLAARLPAWSIVALAIGFELFTLVAIRDSLVLNVVGFFHTFPAVAEWQRDG